MFESIHVFLQVAFDQVWLLQNQVFYRQASSGHLPIALRCSPEKIFALHPVTAVQLSWLCEAFELLDSVLVDSVSPYTLSQPIPHLH